MNLNSALRDAKESVPLVLEMLEETVTWVDHTDAVAREMSSYICRSLLRSGQILDSIQLLSEKCRYQDMWVLCRTLTETATNLCYLQVAPKEEYSRWSSYDVWTEARMLTKLEDSLPGLDSMLDRRQRDFQRENSARIKESGLYEAARPGSWSAKYPWERAKIADDILGLELGTFQLLHDLVGKTGNAFVHSSPKGIGDQTSPVIHSGPPSDKALQATIQVLAFSSTGVYGAVNFTRVRLGLSKHPFADKFAEMIQSAHVNAAF